MKPSAFRFGIIVLLFLCVSFSALAGEKIFTTFEDFSGEKIASQSGTIFDTYVDAAITGAKNVYYNDLAAQVEAVASGIVSAAALDEPVAMLAISMKPELGIFSEKLIPDSYAYAMRKDDQRLSLVSAKMEELYAAGYDQELAQRWFFGSAEEKVLPQWAHKADFDGSAGTLRVGFDPVVEPMMYADGQGKPLGFEMELISRVAYELNMQVEFVPNALPVRIESLLTDLIDVATGCLSYSEERMKVVSFTPPTYVGGAVLVMRKENLPASKTFTELGDFNGQKIASQKDAVFAQYLDEELEDVQHVLCDDLNSQVQAILDGSAAAAAMDEPVARWMASTNPSLGVFSAFLKEDAFGFGLPKGSPLVEKINTVLAHLEGEGYFQALATRWLSASGDKSGTVSFSHKPSFDGSAGKLKVGIGAVLAPMAYIDSNGDPIGYDVELLRRIAYELNMTIEFVPVTMENRVQMVVDGQVDIAAGTLSITSQRKQLVDFTTPYYHGGTVLLTLKDSLPATMARQRLEDFAGATIANNSGAVLDQMVDSVIPNVKHVYYNSIATLADAVLGGMADALVLDFPMAQLLVKQRAGLEIFPQTIADDEYGFALRKGDPLLQQINQTMKALYNQGYDKELAAKWFSADESAKNLPVFDYKQDFDGSAGTLRVGCDLASSPMVYPDAKGNPIGYDIELLSRIAYEMNMHIQLIPTDLSVMVESLLAQRIDVGACCMSITPERRQVVAFTDPYFTGGTVLVVPKATKISQGYYQRFEDFAGTKIASQTGTIFDSFVNLSIANVQHVYYNDLASQTEAVLNSTVAAAVLDEPVAQLVISKKPALEIFPRVLMGDQYGFALRKGDPLIGKIDSTLEMLYAQGYDKELADRWFSADETIKKVPAFTHKQDFDGSAGTLRVGFDPVVEPMMYADALGQPIGYDVELLSRIAYELNMNIAFVPTAIQTRIEAVLSNKIDVASACLSITEERQKVVAFTQPYYIGGAVLIVKTQVSQTEAQLAKADTSSFKELFITGFNRTFIIEGRYKLIFSGLLVTLWIAFEAALFGTLLGFLLCLMRRSEKKWVSIPARIYINIIRGLPVLVILMILAFVVFLPIKGMDPILVAIIGFALNFAAYFAEILRTGIDGVSQGQTEAAYALGFGRMKTFLKVVLPQAIRQVLPVYRGEIISMLKTTSIVGYISIQDLTKAGDIIRSRTFDAFFPLLTTALLYYLLAYALTAVLKLLEKRIDPKKRKREVKGVVVK